MDGTRAAGGPCRREAPGFSLVEVLLALLLLTVAVLGVAGLALGVARESRRSGRETARALAAQRALDSLRHAGFERADDGRSTLVLDGREWRVAWEVVREAPDLKRVEVHVSGAGRRRDAPFAVTRLHRRHGGGSGGAR